MNRTRRGLPGWLLFVLLVVMPLLELFVLIQVGQVIGAAPTVLLLLVSAVVGASLVKREGARAWAAFNGALAQGRLPTKELADGVMVLAGGVLMMAPGFVSDVMGLLFVLPFTRPLIRPALVALLAPRLRRAVHDSPIGYAGGFPDGFGMGSPQHGAPQDARHPGAQENGPVVRGEVMDD